MEFIDLYSEKLKFDFLSRHIFDSIRTTQQVVKFCGLRAEKIGNYFFECIIYQVMSKRKNAQTLSDS